MVPLTSRLQEWGTERKGRDIKTLQISAKELRGNLKSLIHCYSWQITVNELSSKKIGQVWPGPDLWASSWDLLLLCEFYYHYVYLRCFITLLFYIQCVKINLQRWAHLTRLVHLKQRECKLENGISVQVSAWTMSFELETASLTEIVSMTELKLTENMRRWSLDGNITPHFIYSYEVFKYWTKLGIAGFRMVNLCSVARHGNA